MLPGRRSRQGRRCARTRGGSSFASRRQAGQPGDLLRARWRLRGVHRARGARDARARRRSSIARARSLGTHDGVHRFTIGQRKGLGLSASRAALRARHQLRHRRGRRRSARRVRTHDAHGVGGQLGIRIAGERLDDASPRKSAIATRRRRHACAPIDRDRAELVFDEPQTAITPGQAVVFYEGDVVRGWWVDRLRSSQVRRSAVQPRFNAD